MADELMARCRQPVLTAAEHVRLALRRRCGDLPHSEYARLTLSTNARSWDVEALALQIEWLAGFSAQVLEQLLGSRGALAYTDACIQSIYETTDGAA